MGTGPQPTSNNPGSVLVKARLSCPWGRAGATAPSARAPACSGAEARAPVVRPAWQIFHDKGKGGSGAVPSKLWHSGSGHGPSTFLSLSNAHPAPLMALLHTKCVQLWGPSQLGSRPLCKQPHQGSCHLEPRSPSAALQHPSLAWLITLLMKVWPSPQELP